MLSLHCCAGFSLVAACGGYFQDVMLGLLIVVAPLVAKLQGAGFSNLKLPGFRAKAQLLWHRGFVAPPACGIFPAHGSDPLSPALVGGFFTTEPLEKPENYYVIVFAWFTSSWWVRSK